ncbi:MAG TPA: GNAT family N-acetyltransferase [Caldithrix abyssi]|uniref:GNAT family N-acetyltransferase n=1 Tax=Caldithrix abyssi TaxID=187145 RepID=A0A7V5H336_CALAY|nr:GNAT family N-acetyltransferase [Caldithrix abyssi]
MSRFPEIIKTTVITKLDEFYTLEQEWDQLIDSMPDYLPTMTFQWHRAWLEVNQPKIQKIHIFVFRDQEENVIGIVPLVKTQASLFRKKLMVYTFSGARDQIKTLIICKHEHHIQLLLELLTHFYEKHHDWDLLTLRRLASSHADEIFLERILKKHHWPFSVESQLKIPYIFLEGDFESYFKSRKKHFRNEVKRKSKQLNKMGNVRYRVLTSPIDEKDFNRFVEMENAGWKGNNKSSLLHRERLLALFKNLSQLESKPLKLVMYKMLLNEQLISASLCFQTKNSLHVFKIAYDEKFKRQSPGLLLRLFEIEDAFARGLKIYDFSGKAQRWMRDFTNRQHYVMDYIIYRKTLASLIRYLGFTRLKPLIKHSSISEKFLKNLIDE